MNDDTVILVPILGRPHLIAPLMANVAATTDPDVTLMFLPDSTDAESIAELLACGAHWMDSDATGWAGKINAAVRDHPWWRYIFCGADDVIFHDRWLDEVTRVMSYTSRTVHRAAFDATHAEDFTTETPIQVVGTLDNLTSNVMAGEHAVHYMVDRAYIDDPGGVIDQGPGSFLPEHYRHNYTDTEFIETAKKRGVFAPSTAVVEHAHWLAGTTMFDETYRIGEDSKAADAVIFEQRRHLWQ